MDALARGQAQPVLTEVIGDDLGSTLNAPTGTIQCTPGGPYYVADGGASPPKVRRCIGGLGNGCTTLTASVGFPLRLACAWSSGWLYALDWGGTSPTGARVFVMTDPASPVLLASDGTASFGYALAALSDGAVWSDYASSSANGNKLRQVRTGVVSTLAGTGAATTTGDGGPAIAATMKAPEGVAVDRFGNVYEIESQGYIRRVNAATGLMERVGGDGFLGDSGDGGPAAGARFNPPATLAIDGAGDLYVTERLPCRIRRIAGVDTAPMLTPQGGSTAPVSTFVDLHDQFGSDAACQPIDGTVSGGVLVVTLISKAAVYTVPLAVQPGPSLTPTRSGTVSPTTTPTTVPTKSPTAVPTITGTRTPTSQIPSPTTTGTPEVIELVCQPGERAVCMCEALP